MMKNLLDIQEDRAIPYLKTLGFSDEAKALQNIRLLQETPFKRHLEELVTIAVMSPSADDALNNMERVASQLATETISVLAKDKKNLKNLITLCGSSHLLVNTIVKHPEYLKELLFKGGLKRKKDLVTFLRELEELLHDLSDFNSVANGLRLFKQKEYLRIGARDILGIASMQETTRELSDLASASLEIAYKFCLAQLKKEYGMPLYTNIDGSTKESDFTIIGMGKLGGMELNFSSDIDILYIYSSDKGETTGIEKDGQKRGQISLHTFYVKLSEQITKIISAVTEDGIVFRVDLNLRPEGKNGDLANSLRSAEIYYESWGQTWERAAMIKARPVAGSVKLGENFLQMTEPFVFRRHLDFTAIDEIKGMKERIDLSLLRANPNAVDVKLGIGGIREIEFFVQAIQLINGGKNKTIREKNTLHAVEALKNGGYMNRKDANTLQHAYVFLRNLEHRLQIVEGRQTQVVPANAAELERLARMLGFKETPEMKAAGHFWNEYKKQTSSVHEIYDNLFYGHAREIEEGVSEECLMILSEDMGKEEIMKRLSSAGFSEPQLAYENIKLLKEGPPFAHFPVKAKMLLKRIAPFLLTKIIASPAPDRALGHLERFISAIGARTTFYSLLAENKKVMELLVRLFSISIFLSMAIIEHPENLDVLLSPEVNRPRKNKEDFVHELSGMLEAVSAYEDQLDVFRRFRNSEILRIGINDIFGALDPQEVSQQISYCADACLIKAYETALLDLETRFGKTGNDATFAVLSLGKHGGEELIYSSDLDIIFIYSTSGETRGPKIISNHEFFAKLGQRIITILSIPTREGFAFKVDTRLRPSGSSGPLVTSEEAFLRYQKDMAQLWEKQAMLKARFAAGDAEFGSKILNEVQKYIYASALTKEDLKELYRIRKRMEAELAKEGSGRYNIKFGRGGLVDVEFTVQILQLKFGKEISPIRNPNTFRAIDSLKDEGIISEMDYAVLKDSCQFYRLLENRLRIVQNRVEGDIVKGSPELDALAKRLGYTGGDADKRLLDVYVNHANRVRDLYERIMGIQTESSSLKS